jgi:predicted Rossmann-fold nucleotide-binding protein
MNPHLVKIPLAGEGAMTTLSRTEVDALLDASTSGLYESFRRCCLAVLNSGQDESDNIKEILAEHQGFAVKLNPKNGGVELELIPPPASAFVDGQIIRGIREHLYSVLRDILFTQNEVVASARFDLTRPEQLTSAVFEVLRNADVLRAPSGSRLVVCWGGHSIVRGEYEYTKRVGYQLGLRGLDICTGCGPGAMKGPMKGATIGHSKQRIHSGRYIGISEPGIIAAEAPNPIVNKLVIMPDIEKRLEAFIRLGHAFIIFPGGVGTAEELLYVLGIALHPRNEGRSIPVILTGDTDTQAYLNSLDEFIGITLGDDARKKYEIIVGDPQAVARTALAGTASTSAARTANNDATYFNWKLHIDPSLQQPFLPTHETMAALNLRQDQPPHLLAASLRSAFSGIVAANIKETGIGIVERDGPMPIRGPKIIVEALEQLLNQFASAKRMTVRDDYVAPYVLEAIT